MKRKDGICRHRLLRGDIPNAEASEVDWCPVLPDQHVGAGKPSGRDLIFEKLGQALKSGGWRRCVAGGGLSLNV